MTTSEKFKHAENRGRNAAIKVFTRDILPDGWTIKEAPDRRYFDAIIYHGDEVKAIVEIKYRNIKSTDYDEAILTDNKYERLNKSEYPAFYIALYSDNKYYIWDIKKVNPRVEKKWCNAVTVLSRLKVEKETWFIKLDEAKYTGYINEPGE